MQLIFSQSFSRNTRYLFYLLCSAYTLACSLYLNSVLISCFGLFSCLYLFSTPIPLKTRCATYPLYFFIFLVGSSYWLIYCLLDFSGLGFWSASVLLSIAFFAFAWVLSLPCFVFQSLRNHFHTSYSLSFLLILFDYLRMHTFLATPWLTFGQIPINLSVFKALYPIGGCFLAAYFTLRVLEVFAHALQGRVDKSNRPVFFLLLLLLLYTTSGTIYSFLSTPNTKNAPLSIQLIQPNFSHLDKRDPFLDWQTTLQLLSLTPQNNNLLNVLPEGMFNIPKSELTLAELSQTNFFYNSILGISYQYDTNFNPVILGTNQVHGHYIKKHLVPFGEYVPFSHWLKPYVSYFNHRYEALSNPNFALLSFKNFKFYPLICYDLFFPLGFKSFAQHADALIAVAENTWYRDSAFQPMFLRSARIRALESQTPLLLDMNRGYTSHINANGDIVSFLPFDTRDQLKVNLYHKMPMRFTPYLYLSDGLIVLMICLFETLCLLAHSSVSYAKRHKG